MHILFMLLMSLYQPKLIYKPFPHGSLRDTTDNYIIIHYDSGFTTKSTFQYLRKKHNSYHYFIDRTGVVYKLIDPRYKANHAGISIWDGKLRMNKYSIGICLQNDGRSAYTEEQYMSLNWLINIQKNRFHDLTDNRILGHQDIAFPIGRKSDPGKYFDWTRIRHSLGEL